MSSTDRPHPLPALIVGAILLTSPLLCGAASLLDSLNEEASAGGAKVDATSVNQVSKQDFESDLQKKYPGTYLIYMDLPHSDRNQVFDTYRGTLQLPSAVAEIVRLSHAARTQ